MPRPHARQDFKDENRALEPFSGRKAGSRGEGPVSSAHFGTNRDLDSAKATEKPPGGRWSLPYQIFNNASKRPPLMLMLSKCQSFWASQLQGPTPGRQGPIHCRTAPPGEQRLVRPGLLG